MAEVFQRWIRKVELEPPVRQLLVRMVRFVVLLLFGLLAITNLGFELLPLIAGLGVAGALAVYQQWLMRDREPARCFAAFLNNNYFGMAVFVGLALDYPGT